MSMHATIRWLVLAALLGAAGCAEFERDTGYRARALAGPPAGVSQVDVPLAAWLASRPHASPGSLTTFPSEPVNQEAFGEALRALLDGKTADATTFAKRVGYEVVALSESGNWYLLLEEADYTGLGPTVVLSMSPSRNLIAEAPHAALERGTAEEAAFTASMVGARAVIISGAHRCASQEFSVCSGTTVVCGLPGERYRTSDVSHNLGTLFDIANRILADAWPEAIVIQFHGMRREDKPTWVVLSDGSKEQRAGDRALTGAVRDRLRSMLPSGPAVAVSCNDPEDDQFEYRKLCGFTNVQGRYVNGSANPCTENAPRSSGRFLHLEQSWEILEGFERGWGNIHERASAAQVLEAIAASVPCMTDDCPDF